MLLWIVVTPLMKSREASSWQLVSKKIVDRFKVALNYTFEAWLTFWAEKEFGTEI
ncbi:protein of unknown function [Cupriavidus taiwanensis]|uniref:Uncharacterized protein n=1 Tax=Cupriavidus taiwanensis TaxID=164546 RepID=A0A9Q7XNA1_9BURK|nr:protein of unknown function [Cupriavidus taiwanensis]